jgi:hypothetical protein
LAIARVVVKQRFGSVILFFFAFIFFWGGGAERVERKSV